jgi:hypothetical protein
VELLAILPHDGGHWLQPNANPAVIVNVGAFGGNAPDDILSGQILMPICWHLDTRFASNAICGVKRLESTSLQFFPA